MSDGGGRGEETAAQRVAARLQARCEEGRRRAPVRQSSRTPQQRTNWQRISPEEEEEGSHRGAMARAVLEARHVTRAARSHERGVVGKRTVH